MSLTAGHVVLLGARQRVGGCRAVPSHLVFRAP